MFIQQIKLWVPFSKASSLYCSLAANLCLRKLILLFGAVWPSDVYNHGHSQLPLPRSFNQHLTHNHPFLSLLCYSFNHWVGPFWFHLFSPDHDPSQLPLACRSKQRLTHYCPSLLRFYYPFTQTRYVTQSFSLPFLHLICPVSVKFFEPSFLIIILTISFWFQV